MSMFCYQCEQAFKGEGCVSLGICGKDPVTAQLQDILFYATKGLAVAVHALRQAGAVEPSADNAIISALFTTVTNVNFDSQRIMDMINETVAEREKVISLLKQHGASIPSESGAVQWKPADDIEKTLTVWESISIPKRRTAHGDDIVGLQELLVYGMKGVAAYAHHAHVLGADVAYSGAFFAKALNHLETEKPEADSLMELCMECGEINYKIMETLDFVHTSTYGHPVPTQVRITPVKGKAILVSGHDLKDLEELLKQTEGKGINIYTHGEMLPAHGYPELKKYAHLVGNYGGAWQKQIIEFDAFPGPIVMTTNCIQNPKETYKTRIFTRSLVGWPGVTHLNDTDFTPVIESALSAPGFESDEPEKTITVGFGHNAVLSVADQVVSAVKSGAIKHFFLIGGCDGAKPGRNYYTDFAQKAPKDTIILTLACGKYRFNKLDFGDINGIPRLLDIGQCNDAYSAIKIASALADAFKTDINSLPLSLIISWYEQKAVAILLTLLFLGVKNIKLGPSLPAFVSPNVLNVLVEQFQLAPISDVESDMAAALSH